DIEATAVTHPKDGLGIKLVRNAETRCERLVGIVNVAVQADRALTRHANHALIQVRETAVVFSIDALRKINFPTQSVRNCEFWTDPPRVLSVEEPALLTLCSRQ